MNGLGRSTRILAAALSCGSLVGCIGFGSGLVGKLGGTGRSEQINADGMRGTVLDVTGSLAAVQDERSRTTFMVEVPTEARGSLQPGVIVDISGEMAGGILRAKTARVSGGTAWPRVESVEESQDNIQHVLFVLQENHSFDNYFGTFPGANGLPPNVTVEGVAPYHLGSFRTGNLAHGMPAVRTAVNGGAMDRFVTAERSRETMGYYDGADIPNYWAYARYFTLADNFFSSSSGPSLPNHLFALAASAGGETTNRVIPPAGGYGITSLPERLDQAGVSWKIYDGSANLGAFTALDPFPGLSFFMKDGRVRARLATTARLFQDLSSGELPAAAWVFPNAEESEHPLTDIRVGMWYVTAIANALMKSPYWRTTVLVVSWDEYGGFYDHVAPTADGMGIRVPALIISARARPGYVDHTRYDFSSVLKLIERRFRLSPLSGRDAEAQDIGGSLDMAQPPLAPLLIGAP